MNEKVLLLVAGLVIIVFIGLLVVAYKRRKSADHEQKQEKQTAPEEAPKEVGNTWRERYRMK